MVLRALIILNPTIFALYDLKQDPAPFQIITPYPKITLSGYQGHPKLSTFSSKSGLGRSVWRYAGWYPTVRP